MVIYFCVTFLVLSFRGCNILLGIGCRHRQSESKRLLYGVRWSAENRPGVQNLRVKEYFGVHSKCLLHGVGQQDFMRHRAYAS